MRRTGRLSLLATTMSLPCMIEADSMQVHVLVLFLPFLEIHGLPLLFLIDRRGGWTESEVGMEGLALKGPRKRRLTYGGMMRRGGAGGPRGSKCFALIANSVER